MDDLGEDFELDLGGDLAEQVAVDFLGKEIIETHEEVEKEGSEDGEEPDNLESYLPVEGVTIMGKARLPFPVSTRLTRFEIAKLVKERARELQDGATPFYEPLPHQRGPRYAIQVAREEIMRKLPPLIINRRLPDGSEINISLKDAIIDSYYLPEIGVDYGK